MALQSPKRTSRLISDRKLLECYQCTGAPDAFQRLVERHGPLVLRVCQRILRNSSDAEDAFQTTFVALFEAAPRLDPRQPLQPWLSTVAYRVAWKLRLRRTRRQCHEMTACMPVCGFDQRQAEDWSPVVAEELAHLPASYRKLLTLCYVEGKTHRQAARHLGWRSGSVSHRMARARELLRNRLLRRGVSFAVALWALLGRGARAIANRFDRRLPHTALSAHPSTRLTIAALLLSAFTAATYLGIRELAHSTDRPSKPRPAAASTMWFWQCLRSGPAS